MHGAEQYLRNPANPSIIRIQYLGHNRTLRIVNKECVYLLALRKQRRGSLFSDWSNITKVSYPKTQTAEESREKLISKYIKEAKKATFTNPFIRKCLVADIAKSAHENDITTGNRIDGKIISIKTLLKHAPFETERFLNALRNKQKYSSGKFMFQGYECHFSVGVYTDGDTYYQSGDVSGCLSKEFKDCANGYYYLLINEDNFIGYDID